MVKSSQRVPVIARRLVKFLWQIREYLHKIQYWPLLSIFRAPIWPFLSGARGWRSSSTLRLSEPRLGSEEK
ncbi:hypothetical protein CY34DRAFT_635788 [Suillus luteus UH-Slu-Lm8-n1]|uniref:Uncharacterized protein n=1 Tax=Suillus luteus UH-Slu-Lm8-n1 TaxID=930992 RepID=A0A0D0ARH0_9AGAM|nr:hypothetical protein CY34DRAFT_635788 [Suillus luteus UH-Slu-Lm8-n1]